MKNFKLKINFFKFDRQLFEKTVLGNMGGKNIFGKIFDFKLNFCLKIALLSEEIK